MIVSNLSEILWQKRLKIAKVINDTGISRPTLTTLYYNTSKGINFYTLNVLCSYLKVLPSDILKFYPIDIKNIDVAYTGYEYKYIDTDEEHNNSEEKIEIADFNGSVQFEQVVLPVINFKGYFTHSYADKYNLNIFYQCTRKEFHSLAEDAAIEYIEDCIYSALTENFPERRYCEIDNIDVNFFNSPSNNTHSVDE